MKTSVEKSLHIGSLQYLAMMFMFAQIDKMKSQASNVTRFGISHCKSVVY